MVYTVHCAGFTASVQGVHCTADVQGVHCTADVQGVHCTAAGVQRSTFYYVRLYKVHTVQLVY